MLTPTTLALALFIFLGALLYSSVGHGGASAYLAVMAIFELAPAEMKPAALVLNVMVAGIATVAFARAGHLDLGLLLPFAAGSVPLAAIGGALSLDASAYRPIVGCALVVGAARLAWKPKDEPAARRVSWWAAAPIGAALGLLSGLVGVGGGIFLSPLLLVCRWADARTTAAVSAAFILANSLAALGGLASQGLVLPSGLPAWAVAAVAGGLLGSREGSRRLAPAWLRRLLAVVLVVAALKLFLA